MKTIYYIKDKRIDKVIYIGQTKNFSKRKQQHFSLTKQPVDLYMYEQGRDNFVMDKFYEYPDTMADDELRKIEDELILKYNTIEDGLNKWRSGNIKRDNYQEYHATQMIEWRKTEKYDLWRKDYYSRPEVKEKTKEKNREYNREYKKSEKYKEYMQTDKYKESHRLSNKKWYENKKHEKLNQAII